jgi:hypothetical protein
MEMVVVYHFLLWTLRDLVVNSSFAMAHIFVGSAMRVIPSDIVAIAINHGLSTNTDVFFIKMF